MTGTLTPPTPSAGAAAVNPHFDWKRIAYLVLASRGIDDTEEKKLIPEKKVVYQFSARGHELAQIILGSLLDGEHDAAGAYYRSRPLLLTLGLSLEDAFAGPLRKSGRGYYDYAPGAIAANPKEDRALGNRILDRIVAMLINEAADAVLFRVASAEDIDTAMTKGVNYPRGLLAWADEIGTPVVLGRIESLHSEYGEDRYRPNALLRRMAAEGKSFFKDSD